MEVAFRKGFLGGGGSGGVGVEGGKTILLNS